jgi:hypothetical protein
MPHPWESPCDHEGSCTRMGDLCGLLYPFLFVRRVIGVIVEELELIMLFGVTINNIIYGWTCICSAIGLCLCKDAARQLALLRPTPAMIWTSAPRRNRRRRRPDFSQLTCFAWSQKAMGMPTSVAAGGQLHPASVALALNADPCVYSSTRRKRAPWVFDPLCSTCVKLPSAHAEWLITSGHKQPFGACVRRK